MVRPNYAETVVERIIRIVGRYWRRVKYQWLNTDLWTDLGVAGALFLAAFLISQVLPAERRSPVTPGLILLAFAAVVPPVLMTCSFLKVLKYLKAEVAYEDLRASARPRISRYFAWLLRFPCTAVVLFSIFVGVLLAALGLAAYGPALRTNLIQAVAPLPPVTVVLSKLVLVLGIPRDDAWPTWSMFLLSSFYSAVVIALVLAWFQRGKQRQNYVASLFTDEPRLGTPYAAHSEFSDGTVPEPHEVVLLMKAERIGAVALPYLQVELSGPEWTPTTSSPDCCRGAIAALERIYTQRIGVGEVVPANPETCWKSEPAASDWIAGWLLDHLGKLLELDRSQPDSHSDHRLAEAVESTAAMIASGQSLPSRPAPGIRGTYQDRERGERLRGYLRDLFARSPNRPVLLIAACQAAEFLGQEEDLRLLDEQTRHLDVQAGFTLKQTDRILQSRDRVLTREPIRSRLANDLGSRVKKLGLEPVPALPGQPLRFRRPSDGGLMVLVASGSFIRGDDHSNVTSPMRRVHVSSYLIDVDPVPQQAFDRWLKQHGGILRVERGFFPVQVRPGDLVTDHEYASHITWFAAQAYARGAIEGGHLPTEVQWEKAVRGVEDERRYPSGEVWVEGALSPFGIRACHLLEWTMDVFHEEAYRRFPSIFDPFVEATSSREDEALRVVRGRSPEKPLADFGLVNRSAMEPLTGAFTVPVGFRVAVGLSKRGEA